MQGSTILPRQAGQYLALDIAAHRAQLQGLSKTVRTPKRAGWNQLARAARRRALVIVGHQRVAEQGVEYRCERPHRTCQAHLALLEIQHRRGGGQIGLQCRKPFRPSSRNIVDELTVGKGHLVQFRPKGRIGFAVKFHGQPVVGASTKLNIHRLGAAGNRPKLLVRRPGAAGGEALQAVLARKPRYFRDQRVRVEPAAIEAGDLPFSGRCCLGVEIGRNLQWLPDRVEQKLIVGLVLCEPAGVGETRPMQISQKLV